MATDRDPSQALVERLFGTAAGRRRLTRLPGGDGLAWYALHYLRLATPDCHRRWYESFARARRLLFLAPRSHGKSISAGRVLVGHAIVTNRNVRILLIGKTKGAAAKTARMVRRDLETNPRLREDWASAEGGGPFRERGISWTDSMFYVRRTANLRDPTVEAVGVGGAITGGRFDLIIVDDPVDDENVHTKSRRAKLKSWFYGTVLPLLDKGGRVVVIGTKKHADDIFTTLESDPTFTVVRDGAFVDGMRALDLSKVERVVEVDRRTGREVLVDVRYHGEPPRTLWPEKWTWRDMLMVLLSIGSVLFLREYQNEIIDDGSSPFRQAWLAAARERGKGRRFIPCEIDPDTGEVDERVAGLILWQCWDLSLVDDAAKAEEQNSDYAVGMTWGLDWQTGDRYLLHAVRVRGRTQGELLSLIRQQAALWPSVIAVVVENNAFGRLYEAGLKRETGLPIYGHTTDKKKHDLFEGVPGMSSLFENGKVILPWDGDDPVAQEFVEVLCAELHGLGREKHDDTAMALWVGDVWIRRYIAAEERRRGGGKSRVSGGERDRRPNCEGP